ncbi:MAG: glycosyltransferase family 2 protein [Gemmatimonadota bacterium]|nr:glycosyltransferase family 2 protein [Gemmatimonadota bacterium]
MTRLAALPVGVSWELIVVDNACTDRTVDVLESFMGRLPLRRVFEPKSGLSNARNAAIAEAHGGHIVWTDDDVLVGSEWLAAYVRAFARYPDVAFFGGPIAAWFDVPPAAWLMAVLPQVGGAFAVREFDARDEAITTTFVPFGANMALRTDVLRATGFDPRLGRVRAGMLGGEETALMSHLLARGETGRWVPGASVRHYIPPERQTIRHLRRYYSGEGVRMALVTNEGRQSRMLFGRPRWAWRAAIQNEIVYRVRRLTSRPEIWIEDLKRASAAWGFLRYARVD